MEEEVPLLVPCSICGRTFKPESLEKHYKACERNSTNKRKVFDSTIQRIQGTDLAEFLPKILKKSTESKSPRDKPEKVIEYSKPEKKKNTDVKPRNGVSSPTPKTRDSCEQCPHCERSFCLKAFDRHVEWCKARRAPVAPSPNTLKAKEMLDARLKYQAPKHSKYKRRQSYEKTGTQVVVHEGKNSLYHFPNEFRREKVNDIVECNTQLFRPKGSHSAPSCNLLKRSSSSAKLPPQASSNFEIPSNFHNAQGNYSGMARHMKTFSNAMVQQLTAACNNMLCDSTITERQTSLASKESETSIENQTFFSVEDISTESGMQDSGLDVNQSCYSTDFGHSHDYCLESLLPIHEEKVNLTKWSSRQSVMSDVSSVKRANFCHECGSKYPIEGAKFCCECGEQRLILKTLSHIKI